MSSIVPYSAKFSANNCVSLFYRLRDIIKMLIVSKYWCLTCRSKCVDIGMP